MFDNNSLDEEFLSHVISAYVILDRHIFKCKECDESFTTEIEYTKHLVSHIALRKIKDSQEDRFMKRHKCEKCDKKFVLKSTLDAHAFVHEPFPHICFCGVGFYEKNDLRSHKGLVHLDEIKKETTNLTLRKKRAILNESWLPISTYSGPKVKEEYMEEQESRIKPRLKAELVIKDKKEKSKPNKSKVKTERKPRKSNKGIIPYCKLCDKTFSQHGTLKLHMDRHAGITRFECDVCGKRFYDKCNLQTHFRIHTEEKPFTCPLCKKAFSDISAYKRHERTHSGVKPYACGVCGMRFSDASGRIAHEKRHTNVKNVKCEKCLKQFYNRHSMMLHYTAVHTTKKKHKCPKCFKTFAIRSYLCIHLKNYHSKQLYQCDYCSIKFKSKSYLTKHIKEMHVNKHIKKYACTNCDMKFRTKTCLDRHVDNLHLRQLKFSCDYCGKRFNDRCGISSHIVEKHLNIKCNICSKAFIEKRKLIEHQKVGCIRCKVCNIALPSYHRLASHSIVHQKLRPYNCKYCFNSFKSDSAVRKHYQHIHSDEINYECNDCGKGFVTKHSLRNHIFSQHLDFFYCNICGRRFFNLNDLHTHKTKCLKENLQVTCEICEQSVRKSYYRAHLLNHSGMRKFQCDYCGTKNQSKSGLVRHIRLMHLKRRKGNK